MSRLHLIGILGVALLISLLVQALIGLPVRASTEVGGPITGNITWAKASSPYIVTANVLVQQGVTLTVEPGVVVEFNSGKGMQIDGELIAIGTQTEQIVFTSNQPIPNPGDWVNLRFTDASVDAVYDEEGNYFSGSIMQYCAIEYGGSGAPLLEIYWSSPCIDHDSVTHSASGGIYAYAFNGSIVISNCNIMNNSGQEGGGISAWATAAGSITINNCNIMNNSAQQGGGIYTALIIAGALTINNCTITNNSAQEGGGIYTYYSPPVPSPGTSPYGLNMSNRTIIENMSGQNSFGIHINYNNLYSNTAYDIYNSKEGFSHPVDATNNWWGTTDEATIQAQIYDWYDDASLAIVDYIPYLTSPITSPYECIDIHLKVGWNMVSVPVTPGNSSVNAVFPGVAAVYTWDPVSKNYVIPTTIEPCKGYWVAVTSEKTITVCGTCATCAIDIKAGWNLIGATCDTVSMSDTIDDPDGSVQPFAYWWNPDSKSYDYKTTIEPGKGYWVASVRDCRLWVSIQVYQKDRFEIDSRIMQLASATFYADGHSGWKDINGDDIPDNALTFADNVWCRKVPDTVDGYYFPTARAKVNNHVLALSTSSFDPANPNNPLILGAGGSAAIDLEIQSHAIWMGLLVNDYGGCLTDNGSQDRGQVSPLDGENALYIDDFPASAMAGNNYNGAPQPGGSYCWVVGNRGQVYGAYKGSGGSWYAGFKGIYP